MNSFRSLDLPFTMNTSHHDLCEEFFQPLLATAIRYDRGVGYFSSGWFRINARGMLAFAEHAGRARWVTSPILDAADWEALQTGDAARRDPVLRAVIERSFTELERTLEQDTLSAIAWMVADDIITVRLALPTRKLNGGDFHDKFGIFTDCEGNKVSFNGSYNDSIQGTRNYESIKVFCSWDPTLAAFVHADADRFERLWENLDPNVRVFDIPEAARARILQLRTSERPYPAPDWVGLRDVPANLDSHHLQIVPVIPDNISLRAYQVEAINAWFAHDCCGLLEMATGTGKTITALASAAQLFEREGRLAIVIAVPYQHLVDQWCEESNQFGYQPLKAYQSKAQWLGPLNEIIAEFNGGYRQFISVITTYSTFSSREFQGSLASLRDPALLIADEAHHLGAETRRDSYPEQIAYRLALSATPDRWFDDEGTTALQNFFGPTVFALPLEKAIGTSLTPYYYFPHLVALTNEEMEQYQQLTLQLARLESRTDRQGQQARKLLLIQRYDLLNTASGKLDVLSSLLDIESQLTQALFYCAPGQLEDVLRLLGWNKGLLVHRFTAKENVAERRRILEQFSQGDLHALVAMKCLDEGVDVPGTRTAFILASSGNPREFIQRRGRILRRAPGKEHAVIHDLIAVPPDTWTVATDTPWFRTERGIVRHELQRFKEFANVALNKHQALDVIWEVARRYSLLDF